MQPRVAEIMHADRRLGVEAAQPFELPARARLETDQPGVDAMADRRVITHVEVQMALLAHDAPVATVQHPAFLDVEGAGDDLAVLAREHEAQVALEAPRQQVEERGQQILTAPVQVVHRRPVQVEHDRKQGVRDVLPVQHLDADAALVHLAHFALDLVAALAAEVAEIVVERPVAVIEPLELDADPLQVADLGQAGGLVRQTEIHVHGRQVVPVADLAQRAAQDFDQPRPVAAGRGQKAHARGRRERRRHDQLGIIRDTGALRGVGPAVVEHELAHAVALEIQRAGGQQPVALVQRQMLGLPARFGAHAGRFFETGQPVPLQERRAAIHQGIPVGLPDVTHAAEHSDLQIGHAGLGWTALRMRGGRTLNRFRRPAAAAARCGTRTRCDVRPRHSVWRRGSRRTSRPSAGSTRGGRPRCRGNSR